MSRLPRLRPMTGALTIAQTARSPPYSSRSHFLQIKKQQKKEITPEEILSLKTKKAALMEELRRMSAKLTRGKTAVTSSRRHNANNSIAESLEKQVEQLKFTIQERKKEIREIETSDLAASISELHEESKALYLELERLGQIRVQKTRIYNNSLRQVQDLLDRYSDENIGQMRYLVEVTGRELNKIKHQNNEYERKIKAIEEHNEYIQKTRGHPELQEQINELTKELKAAQKRVREQSNETAN